MFIERPNASSRILNLANSNIPGVSIAAAGKEEVLFEVLGMEMIIKAATNDLDSRPVATVVSTYLDSTWRPTWLANSR
ncbi:hypothetical protein D5086_007739 [Populus alba]|uniref:Uncharacterized protein n=1 Tax=Populus alba TaxID=43335 RepID=A0ACC4CDY1_POPAL